MITNIIYVLATACLFIGSLMTFKNEIPDYFYMAGTSLLLVKSIICFIKYFDKKKKSGLYEDII